MLFLLGVFLPLVTFIVYFIQMNRKSANPHIQKPKSNLPTNEPLKIAIQGSCASGKSTLSKQLSLEYSLPMIDADHHRFYPAHEREWTCKPRSEFERIIQEEVTRLRSRGWTFDGRIARLPLVSSEANVLIWLDYSFLVIMTRLLKRTVLRIVKRESICNGNVESLGNQFTWDGMFVFEFKCFWNYKETEGRILDRIKENPNMHVFRFVSPNETETYLKDINFIKLINQ